MASAGQRPSVPRVLGYCKFSTSLALLLGAMVWGYRNGFLWLCLSRALVPHGKQPWRRGWSLGTWRIRVTTPHRYQTQEVCISKEPGVQAHPCTVLESEVTPQRPNPNPTSSADSSAPGAGGMQPLPVAYRWNSMSHNGFFYR